MKINLEINTNQQIQTSRNISEQLMVCSHERSGTHFTMNTLDIVSDYCSNPWLNYDLYPLGGKINFFNPASSSSFIEQLSNIKVDGTSTCNASILKSHFPASHLGEDANKLPLKIIYIWRDPADTIASLWKFMHRWSYDEGPKTETPLQLAISSPSGQSQRYQKSNYKDYFERWASHVIDGISYCEKNTKAHIISYKQLSLAHKETTKKLCKILNIDMLQEPCFPSKTNNVVHGATRHLDADSMNRLRDLCNERIEEFPILKAYAEKDQYL